MIFDNLFRDAKVYDVFKMQHGDIIRVQGSIKCSFCENQTHFIDSRTLMPICSLQCQSKIKIKSVVGNNFDFYENVDCKYYPCHYAGQSCKFCFCPLYHLECPGEYTMIDGIKDCSACLFPHDKDNFDAIMSILKGINNS